MALPIEAKDLCVGDYSPDYGTIKQVKKSKDNVELTFANGTVLTPNNETEFIVDQGGRF